MQQPNNYHWQVIMVLELQRTTIKFKAGYDLRRYKIHIRIYISDYNKTFTTMAKMMVYKRDNRTGRGDNIKVKLNLKNNHLSITIDKILLAKRYFRS